MKNYGAIKNAKLYNGKEEGVILVSSPYIIKCEIKSYAYGYREVADITDLIIERYNKYQLLERTLLAFKIGFMILVVAIMIILKFIGII